MPLNRYTTADLVLTERRRMEQPLLLLIWLGTAAFSLAEGSTLYFLSGTVGVGVNWLVVRRNMEIYLHRRYVHIGVAVSLLLLAIEVLYTTVPLHVTVGHFMMLIQLLKLFEQKRSRDYLQLMVLSLFLMVDTALICSSVWFAPLVAVYLLLACYVAMVFTIKRGLDEAGAARLRSEPGPLSPRQVAWNVIRQWPGGALQRILWWIAIPALGAGILAFLLTPRAAGLADAASQDVLTTGFHTSICLGQPRKVYQSDRVVLRIAVPTRNTDNGMSLPLSSRYLRGAVLDQYRNSTWKNSRGAERYPFPAPSSPPGDRTLLAAGLVRQTIQTMTLGPVELFAPYPTVGLIPPRDVKVMHSSSLEYAVRDHSTSRRRLRYDALSFPFPLNDRQRAYLKRMRGSGDISGATIELPPDVRARLLALANRWCGDLLEKRRREPDRTAEWNLALARRIEMRLKGQYEYTLDLSESNPTRDGVEDFLFFLHRGHCEYFASAMAVLCNLLEVPARLAVGFVMEEYDPETDEFIIRERDAHAWCEVYSDATDWTIFDPTPSEGRQETTKRPWYAFLKDFFQEIQFQWYQQIVRYDAAEQRNLAERTADGAWLFWMAILRGLTQLRESFWKLLQEGVVDRILWRFLVVLQVLAAGILLLLLLRRIRHLRGRCRAGRKYDFLLEPLLILLEQRGLPSLPSRTLQQHMRQAREQFHLPADRLEALVFLQYRWRWGGQTPSEEELRQARQEVAALCELLQMPSAKRQIAS